MELTRREAVEKFLTAAGIPYIITAQGIQLVSKPIAPEAFLGQCNASLKACWTLLQHAGFDTAQSLLNAHTLTLTDLATKPSKYQDFAADLAVQAKILQAILCMHRMDFADRELACMDAVMFGNITSNLYIRAAALLYHGYFYINCPPYRPEKAIPLFLEALSLIEGDVSFLHVDLYAGLANAHAQNRKDPNAPKNARDALDEAENLLSEHPQNTPDFLYPHGYPEFPIWKGRAFVSLISCDSSYAQKASDIFTLSTPDLITTRSIAQVAVLQADAARGRGDLHQFVECLQEGLRLAILIDSKKRQQEGVEVFHKIPKGWLKESSVQALQRNFLPQARIIVA